MSEPSDRPSETATGEFLIANQLGLHVRAAAIVVRTANRFSARIQVRAGSASADAHSLLDLLTLAATKGTRVQVEAHGTDASQAVEAIGALIARNFEES
ncbi:MAG: phosphocarrier protein HPr [Hyphomicrobiaceae bacterium]|jgi:phosphocarrier protein HPr